MSAPLQLLPLSLSPLHPLPPTLWPTSTSSGQCNHHASERPPFRISLCRSLSRMLSLYRALSLSLSLRCTHCHHTLQPLSTTSGHLRPPLASATTTRASPLHFASLSRVVSLSCALSLSTTPTATTPSDHRRPPPATCDHFSVFLRQL